MRLLLYLSILLIGGIIGYKGILSDKITSKVNLIQIICLLVLLFTMGIRMGADKKILSSFMKIGY